MFSFISKAKILLPFFSQRLADYARLAQLDLIAFRNDTINSTVGAAIGAAALLLWLSFIGLAAIVTAWDTPNRIRVAWIVALGWGLVTGACACLARRLMRGSSPFVNITFEVSRDLAVLKSPEEHGHEQLP